MMNMNAAANYPTTLDTLQVPQIVFRFRPKDPISALTHLIGNRVDYFPLASEMLVNRAVLDSDGICNIFYACTIVASP